MNLHRLGASLAPTLVLAITASRARSDRFQLGYAVLVLVLFCTYIGLLFLQLR